MKGIEHGSDKRMSEVIMETAGVPQSQVAVISGPNLAREIAERQVAASVVACSDEMSARLLQRACHTGYFRPYWNTDVLGCELGGTVKNVIALAVGIAVALGLGDNTKATLITRGLAEMARLGEAMGADPRTFAGLAGMGDLVATCSSPLSRNRRFGEYLGQGMNVAQAQGADHADRGGRHLLRPGPRAGPQVRRGDADHRGGRRPDRRPPVGRRSGGGAHVAVRQAGVVRHRGLRPPSHGASAWRAVRCSTRGGH